MLKQTDIDAGALFPPPFTAQAGVAAALGGGVIPNGYRGVLRALAEAAMTALVDDFWRACETFIMRLILWLLLALGLIEIFLYHLGKL